MVLDREIAECVLAAPEFGAKKVTLFGSALTSKNTARDIDLIVDGVSGWNAIRMGAAMEERISVTVDIINGDEQTPFAEINRARGKVIYEV